MVGELDVEIGDEQLTALALAADPDQSVDPAAVPIVIAAVDTPGLLPDRYMPTPPRAARIGTRRVIAGLTVLALVVVNAAGLCVTYGVPEIAW